MESYIDKERLQNLKNQFQYIYHLVTHIKNCSSYDKASQAQKYTKQVQDIIINTFQYYKEQLSLFNRTQQKCSFQFDKILTLEKSVKQKSQLLRLYEIKFTKSYLATLNSQTLQKNACFLSQHTNLKNTQHQSSKHSQSSSNPQQSQQQLDEDNCPSYQSMCMNQNFINDTQDHIQDQEKYENYQTQKQNQYDQQIKLLQKIKFKQTSCSDRGDQQPPSTLLNDN